MCCQTKSLTFVPKTHIHIYLHKGCQTWVNIKSRRIKKTLQMSRTLQSTGLKVLIHLGVKVIIGLDKPETPKM